MSPLCLDLHKSRFSMSPKCHHPESPPPTCTFHILTLFMARHSNIIPFSIQKCYHYQIRHSQFMTSKCLAQVLEPSRRHLNPPDPLLHLLSFFSHHLPQITGALQLRDQVSLFPYREKTLRVIQLLIYINIYLPLPTIIETFTMQELQQRVQRSV